MIVDRLAYAGLVVLALSLGLGDIAQVTLLDVVVLSAVRGLLPVVLGLALLAAIAQRRRPAFAASLALPVAAWLSVLVLSAVLAPSYRSEALASLERPASGALLAWAVFELCRTEARWRRVARAVALGGVAIALVGLGEASGAPLVGGWIAVLHDGPIPIGDVPRITSTLSHPNEAAMLLELSLPLLVAWAWTAPQPWRTPLSMAVPGVLLGIVLTFSRAGVAAALAALTVMAGVSSRCQERGYVRPLATAALIVPLALVWASQADPGLNRRLTAGVDEASPGQPSRIEFWTAALDMLRDRPLLGVGPDNFRWQFVSYSGVAENNLGIHAHDQYVEALADTGILGLLSLAWLLARLVRHASDGVRLATTSAEWPWRAALLASLSAWLLHALLDDFERFWPTSVAFWLIAGLSLRACAAGSAVEQPEDQSDDRDHHEQDQDARRTGQRGAAPAAAAEAHHAAIVRPRLTRVQATFGTPSAALAGMPEDVQHDRVKRLQADGAWIVEVLPEDEYEREHLVGALNLPLHELTRAAADRVLGGDRARPVVVYCQDVE